jgi:ATP-dependent helicase/nuclease subunit B
VRRLERAALRGTRPAPGLSGLRAAAWAGLAGRSEETAGPALAVLDRLDDCLDTFTALPEAPVLPPADLLSAHLAAAEALAATELVPGGHRLYAGPEGEALASHLAALAPAMASLGPIAPAAWPALFDSAMAGAAAPSFRGSRGREGGPHPRVEILGLLEARLLAFDKVVLGALDETVWPLATDPGPWMSRPMRIAFGLPEPEARIGRVAADFLLSTCAAPQAVLSRAAKRGGAPTVSARWLTRIETFLAGQGDDAHPAGLRLPAEPAMHWAALLDRPSIVVPCDRPAPRPPAEARPDRISVTEVETLIADPYAFYARRVLRLQPLDPLDAEVGAADYGTLVHHAMAEFVRRLGTVWPGRDAATAHFAAAAEAALEKVGAQSGLAAFWRPRLGRIGAFVVDREEELRQNGGIAASHTETTGLLELRHRDGRTVSLTARADRIDRRADGTLAILDYKTGTLPSKVAVQEGHKPQLLLEAAMAAEGCFEGVEASDASELTYWRLTGGPEPGKVLEVMSGKQDISDKASDALERLGELANRFLFGDAAFTARPHPGRAPPGGDYDHLSRLAEWSGAEDAEAGS